jgi:hypothetical protein
MVVVWLLVRDLAGQAALPAWLLVAGLVVLDRTNSVAGSYIFNVELQPSGLASLALLFAVASYTRGNALRTGLGLAAAGIAHINFLLVGLASFGAAQAILFLSTLVPRVRREAAGHVLRRTLAVLGPAVVVLAVNLPMLLAFSRAEEAELGGQIFLLIRSPHHYVPMQWLADFVPFVGWQLLCLPGYWWLRVDAEMRSRLLALHVAMVGLITVATLLTTIVFLPQVSQVYVWRLAPFAVLIAQIVLMIGVVQRIVRGASGTEAERLSLQGLAERWRAVTSYGEVSNRLRLPIFVCGAIGWTLIMLSEVRIQGLLSASTLILGAATVALLAAAFLPEPPSSATQSAHVAERPWRPRRGSLRTTAGIGLGIFVVLALTQLPPALAQSNLLNPDSPPAERALFEWARTTDRDVRFLIPPSLSAFRLRAKRAVVVDWKSTPIMADELVEWYRRINRVSGLRAVPDLAAASRGYVAMDSARLDALDAEFALDYAVIPAGSPLARSARAVVHRNAAFTVLDVAKFLGTPGKSNRRQDAPPVDGPFGAR